MIQSHAEIAVFVRVAETGSFAGCADEFALTPSAVSKLVTRLEDRLGVKLLQRSTRRLSLTPEGETFLPLGRDVLAAVEAAESGVAAIRGKPRGLVRVNTGAAFGKHVLAPALPDFAARYPDIRVELSIAERRIDLVAEQVDVAIRTGDLGDSTLIARRIRMARRIVCAAPAYLERRGVPRTAADLDRHDCLLLTGLSRLAQWPIMVDGRVMPVTVKGPLTSDNADMIYDLALRGLGIVRLGDFMVGPALADGRLVALLEDVHVSEPFPITALMPPGRQNLPRVRAVVDFLVERFGA